MSTDYEAPITAKTPPPVVTDGPVYRTSLATTNGTDGSGDWESMGIGFTLAPTSSGDVLVWGEASVEAPINGQFYAAFSIRIYRSTHGIPAFGVAPNEEDVIVGFAYQGVPAGNLASPAHALFNLTIPPQMDTGLAQEVIYYYLAMNDQGTSAYPEGTDNTGTAGTFIAGRTTNAGA